MIVAVCGRGQRALSALGVVVSMCGVAGSVVGCCAVHVGAGVKNAVSTRARVCHVSLVLSFDCSALDTPGPPATVALMLSMW